MLAYPPPPTAPLDLTVPAADATIVLVALSSVAVCAVLAASAHWRRTGEATFLALLGGGLATALLEPFADLLGLVWFPPHDQVPAFTGLGIPIPLFVVVGYVCLFGIMPMLTLWHLESRPTRGRYWAFSAAMFLSACVFEWVLLTSGTYLYYGRQPLEVLGYPMIWMTINTGACLVVALVLYRFRDVFTGTRVLLLVPVAPCADGAVMLSTGWPAFGALHSDLPMWGVHLAGLATIGLGLLLRAAGAELCCPGGRWYLPPRGASTARSQEPGTAELTGVTS